MPHGSPSWIERLETHQVRIYLVTIAVAALIGWRLPALGGSTEHAINPLLGGLLFVTFLQVPAAELVRALRDGRFVAAVLVVNFVGVPLVIAAMTPFLPNQPAVRLGILLVLLCPCIDYVIVFSGLAGADNRRLLATTPLLLLIQMLALPAFLWLFWGSNLDDVVAWQPFARAFTFLIAIPLALAWLVQAQGNRTSARITQAGTSVMVPLMALTLLAVVSSQVSRLNADLGPALTAIPFYVVFLLVMPLAGRLVARLFALDVASSRAVVFTGATRNSLVVLPLALALPGRFAVTALVVVTQTVVEVIGMVVYVRLVPRLLPASNPASRQE